MWLVDDTRDGSCRYEAVRGTYATVGNATWAVSKYLSMRQIYTKWGPLPISSESQFSIGPRCLCVCKWCSFQRFWFWTCCIVDWYVIKWEGYGSRCSWRNWGIMQKFNEENKEKVRIAWVQTWHLQPTRPQEYCYRLHAPHWRSHSSISKPTSLSLCVQRWQLSTTVVVREMFGQRRKNDRQHTTVTVFSNCWVYLIKIYVRNFL
jgi:hypothetical protein